MSRGFSLPPVIAAVDDQDAYAAERERAQAGKILASMELKLHGRVSGELRQVMNARPAKAASDYDPHRW